ncbi:caspase family protein [Tropicimonas sp. TH_r6]|uniref:caspase family protein n=1 Tax=Tropicimonas sp. TH_r6 TaxID=3082085 RepID=UPI00295590D4|nr:caspase family protein [Tropicimonas sp. TH_r6]MDV7141310.1 caspase family protein [Tropicimonas sp. TH_r6]
MPAPFLTRIVLTLVFLAGAILPAQAEPRFALVVGNESYASVTPLDNPAADARLVAKALEDRGFTVTMLLDADQVTLMRSIAQFGRDLRSGGEESTGLFYYAGHAVQSFGTNFLLPVDVALTDAADLSLVALRADAVLRQMSSAANRTNIVILDACRNNPFVDIPDMNDNGLAEMNAPTGTLMAYSTAPGSVALDGTGSNSPYTQAMVTEMQTPGLTIEQMFKNVRGSVLAATNNRQTPWETSSLTSDFQFTPQRQLSPEEIAEKQFFESLKASRDPVQIVLFLRTYPDSEHFEQARGLLSSVLDGTRPDTGGTTQAAPAPAPVAEPKAPEASERELIEIAQSSGNPSDFQTYLDAFPDGVFAELAQMELAALTETEQAPTSPTPETVVEASAKPAEIASLSPEELTMQTPLMLADEVLTGKSIATLIQGSPLFPPIEGLPDSVWTGRQCTTCHEWSQDVLCEVGEGYVTAQNTRALSKQHPYGGGFKRVLKTWAEGGCR